MKKKVLSVAFVGMFACASVVCGMEPRPEYPQPPKSPAPAQIPPASFSSVDEEVAWFREHYQKLCEKNERLRQELHSERQDSIKLDSLFDYLYDQIVGDAHLAFADEADETDS